MPRWQHLESPVTTYYLLLSATAMLVVIGLVMVLSASSVTSYQDTKSSYTVFFTQLESALVGIVSAFVATHIPLLTWKRLSVLLMAAAIFMPLPLCRPAPGLSVYRHR